MIKLHYPTLTFTLPLPYLYLTFTLHLLHKMYVYTIQVDTVALHSRTKKAPRAQKAQKDGPGGCTDTAPPTAFLRSLLYFMYSIVQVLLPCLLNAQQKRRMCYALYRYIFSTLLYSILLYSTLLSPYLIPDIRNSIYTSYSVHININ